MATGDQKDMVVRLRTAIPKLWFSDAAPVLTALLNGFAYPLALIYSLAAYAKLQTRIKTAIDGFLDLVSFDYFGTTLPRAVAESDTSFRTRIFFNLLREKATRNGMVKILTELTGFAPIIFEPWRPLDTGAYNTNICGYGMAGGYGSVDLPYQAFITAYRPIGFGIPNVAGYGDPEAGYSTGSQSEFANPSLVAGGVTDADIFAAIADEKVEGTIAWAQITNFPVAFNPPKLLQEDGTSDFLLEDGQGYLGLG